MLKWNVIENKMPTMVKLGFDCGGMGLDNFIYDFIGYEEEWEGIDLEQAKNKIREIKNACKKEIMEFLDEYGVENGGEWFYVEYLDVNNDGTFSANGTCFGVTTMEGRYDGKTTVKNFDEYNMDVHESLSDIKGLDI